MKKALSAALLGAGLGLGFTEELYRYVFCRSGSPLFSALPKRQTHDEAYYSHRDGEAARLRALPQERFEIRSGRGERLVGHYFHGEGDGKRIAFLIHGYRSEHAETAGMYWDYYRSRGFDLFCCDHEAHGQSGGKYIGFGCFEADDCLKWIDFLTERFGEDIQILLHGFSMGAATVMLMAPRCPANVKAIVEDSGYQSAAGQLKGQVGPFLPALTLLHRLIAGVDLRKADAGAALRETRIPMLFVQGREDPTVPFRNAPALYESYRGEKDCLFVDGARHVESMHVAPEAYAEKLDALIGKAFS